MRRIEFGRSRLIESRPAVARRAFPPRLCIVLAAGLLAACAEGAPHSPGASIEYPWQVIAPQLSVLEISGAEDYRRLARRAGGRYQESITFSNGASLFYELLESPTVAFIGAGNVVIKNWLNGKQAKEAGFVYTDNAVRRSGDSFSLTNSGTSRTCSFYARVFGVAQGGLGEGDQLYLITDCMASGPGAAAATEQAVDAIAARVEKTPVFAKRSPTLLINPTATAAPAAAPITTTTPPPPPGTAQPADIDRVCYSATLQSLYHAGACWTGDHEAASGEAETYRKRYRMAGKATSDEAMLKIPTPGTRVYTSLGGYMEYVALDGGLVVYKGANRRVISAVGGIVTLAENDELPIDLAVSLWPLKVGKAISFVESSKTASWTVEMEVLRRETIDLPAGRFDAFVVQEHRKGRGSNYHESYRTYWYAPDIGAIVKVDVRLLAGTTPFKPWEALSIASPGAS